MREILSWQRQLRRLGLAGCCVVLATVLLSSSYTTDRTCDYVQKSVTIALDLRMDIPLPDGHMVSGFVKDSTGKPVVGALVTGVDQDGFGSPSSFTNKSGAFSFPVRTGTYDVVAWPPYSTTVDPAKFPRLVRVRVGPFAVADDVETGDMTLLDGYVVSGRVSSDSGTIDALSSKLLASKREKKGSAVYAARLFAGTEESETRYAVALPKGKYSLTLFGTQAFSIPFMYPRKWTLLPACSFVTSDMSVNKDLVRDIKLPRGSELSGTVKDKAGRSLHGELYVRVQGGDPAKDGQATLLAVRNGTFVGYMTPGTYDVIFVPTMERSYLGKATQTITSVTIANAAETLAITAVDGVVVSGRIRDAAGRNVARGSVVLIAAGNSLAEAEAVPLIAVANDKGSYRLCVPPGEYDLHAGPGPSGALALMNVDTPTYAVRMEEPIPLSSVLPAFLEWLRAILASL